MTDTPRLSDREWAAGQPDSEMLNRVLNAANECDPEHDMRCWPLEAFTALRDAREKLAGLDAERGASASDVPVSSVTTGARTASLGHAAPAGTGGTAPRYAVVCNDHVGGKRAWTIHDMHTRSRIGECYAADHAQLIADALNRATPFSGAGRAAVIEECAKVIRNLIDGMDPSHYTSSDYYNRRTALTDARDAITALAARATGEKGT